MAWNFHRLNAACDTPNAERVQTRVLSTTTAKSSPCMPVRGKLCTAITHEGRPVRFGTFKNALTTLADVAQLDPEIIVDSSNWCEESGPHWHGQKKSETPR